MVRAMANTQKQQEPGDRLYFDGSAEPNPGGRMGAGWRLVYSDLPEETGAAEWPAARSNTNNKAEYLALIGVLTAYLARVRPGPLLVLGDSQLVINQMTGEWGINNPALWQLNRQAAALVARPLRKAFVDLPLWLVHWPALRRALGSWTFQLFYWYLLKPLLACGILWLFLPRAFADLPRAALTFMAVNLLLNTRAGHAAQEIVRLAVARLVDLLRAGFLPGLVRVILALFKHAIELVESVLFTVDEWLRFRSDGCVVHTLIS